MKNKSLILCAIAALTLILTACSTSTTEGDTDTDKKADTATPTIETEGNETDEESTTVPAEEEILDEETNNDETRNDETSNDEQTDIPSESTVEIAKEATLTDSDEQDYSMYVLPGYKLTSEEPGKDSLYFENDDAIFMRIETLPKEDGLFDQLVDNTKMVLELTGDGDAPIEITDDAALPSGVDITNVQAFRITTEGAPTTGLVFERGNKIIRLSIFDSKDSKHYDDFIKMSETVTAD